MKQQRLASDLPVRPAPERLLQRKAAGSDSVSGIPSIVHEVLSSPGQPLDATTRKYMEPRFGHDFSGVRIHADAKAAASARAVNAHAYTVGRSVVFGAGQYAPTRNEGRRLMAHELTHVVQQNGATSPSAPIALGAANDASEREASQAAQALSSGAESVSIRGNVAPSVQRETPRGDSLHQPMVDTFRREHGLPESGVDAFGTSVGPSMAEIKYGIPAQAGALAEELQQLINVATWKEIRKRVYPKESAAGMQRAKERKAGTRTDLSGLGQIKTLEHFAAQIHTLQKNWANLKTPNQRAAEIGKIANNELVSANIPGFLIVDKKPMDPKGEFDFTKWKFTLNQELVSSNLLTDLDASELTNTTLHESRHAEQFFLAARHSAGVNGKTANQLVVEHNIPMVIAREAVTKKFGSGTDAITKQLGEKMFNATVINGIQGGIITNNVIQEIQNLKIKQSEASTTLKNLRSVPTAKTIAEAIARRDALKAQIAVIEQKYTLYRNIPNEADAHEVGDAAKQAFDGWK